MLVIAKLEVYIRDTKEYEANYISLRYLLYNVQVFYLGCDSFTSENRKKNKKSHLHLPCFYNHNLHSFHKSILFMHFNDFGLIFIFAIS